MRARYEKELRGLHEDKNRSEEEIRQQLREEKVKVRCYLKEAFRQQQQSELFNEQETCYINENFFLVSLGKALHTYCLQCLCILVCE